MPVPAPLIAPRWRTGALVAIAIGVLVTAWLAVVSYHSASTSFDTWVLRTSYRHLGSGAADALIALSEPAVMEEEPDAPVPAPRVASR